MRRQVLWLALSVSSVTFGAGCAAKHTAAWEVKASTGASAAAGDAAALIKEGDDHFAKRADRAELEAAIAAWDRAVQANPSDAETLAKLTRAVYFLADGYLSFEEDKKDEYLKMHERGMAYGERALVAASPEFKQKVEAGVKIEEAAAVLGKSAVPALYWYTSNLGKWANAQGLATVLKHKAKIKGFIERCAALDEHYFYSAPHRYLGVIYAKAPAIAGGDMKQAKVHFDASLAHTPNYVATSVLWAEFYATRAEDKEGFKKKLEWVLAQPDDVIPELTAETKAEKRKAQKLLSLIEEKF